MDVQKLIEEVKAMTVLELNELVKALEEEFGVSAAVAAAPAAGAAAAPAVRRNAQLRQLRGLVQLLLPLLRRRNALKSCRMRNAPCRMSQYESHSAFSILHFCIFRRTLTFQPFNSKILSWKQN